MFFESALLLYQDNETIEKEVTNRLAKTYRNSFSALRNTIHQAVCYPQKNFMLPIGGVVARQTAGVAAKTLRTAGSGAVLSSYAILPNSVGEVAKQTSRTFDFALGGTINLFTETAVLGYKWHQRRGQRQKGMLSGPEYNQKMKTSAVKAASRTLCVTAGTAVGQLLIPVPFFGAALGGVAGSIFGSFLGSCASQV